MRMHATVTDAVGVKQSEWCELQRSFFVCAMQKHP